MIIVDSNVLMDVLQNNPLWIDWSVHQLTAQARIHELAINPIVYAELSIMYESLHVLDDEIAGMELQLEEMPRAALFLAGKAYRSYRRYHGGAKHNVLPDFFIGAHAAVADCALLTRDPRRYRTYFPTVELITPETAKGYSVHEPAPAY